MKNRILLNRKNNKALNENNLENTFEASFSEVNNFMLKSFKPQLKTIKNRLLTVKKITKFFTSAFLCNAVNAKQTKAFNIDEEMPLVVFDKVMRVFKCVLFKDVKNWVLFYHTLLLKKN